MTQETTPSVLPIRLIYEASALKERPSIIQFVADDAVREALTTYAGIGGVSEFSAKFEVARSGRYGAKVSGEVHAKVEQICVVSLEPFPAEVHETFTVRFAPEPVKKPVAKKNTRDFEAEIEDHVLQVSFEGEDPPEILRDGKIDLGAMAVEFFVLGLDPYPRKPDVDLAQVASGIKNLEVDAGPAPAEINSPFAALAARQKVTKDGE